MQIASSIQADTAAPRSSRRSVAVVGVLGFVLCLFHAFTASDTTPLQRALGALLGLIALGAGWRYWHYQLFDRLPMPEFAFVQMYVYFGMPTITGSLRRGPHAGSDAVTMALVACLLFTGCAIFGVVGGLRLGNSVRDKLARWLPRTLAPGRRVLLPVWIAVVVIASTGALLYLPSSFRFPATVMAESSGVLVFLALRPGEDADYNKTLRSIMPIAVLIALAGLLSGMLEQVLRPLLITATITLLLKRRIPMSWLAAGVVIFVLLNPAKHIFRSERHWSDFDKDHVEATKEHLITGPVEAAEVWWDALVTSWSQDTDSPRHTTGALDRLNYLSGVARTVDWAGRRVPFDRGSRWDVILEFFVPRILNPEKPAITRVFNDRYNYLFGMQSAHVTRSTTVALPLVADGYWNFGWTGIVFLGTLAGIYWGVIASLWNRDHWSLSWIAMALFLTCNVVTPFYGYAVGLLLTAVGLVFTSWALFVASAIMPARNALAPSGQAQ